MRFPSGVILATVLAVVACAAAPAGAAVYTFTMIADSHGPYDPAGWGSINNAGAVAFVENRGGATGVYLVEGGIVSPLLADYGAVRLIQAVRLNDDRTTAFHGSTAGNQSAIYVVPARGTSARNVTPAYPDVYRGFDLNNRGEIVFQGRNSFSGNSYFVTDGTNTRTVFTFLRTDQPVSINDAGTVAFRGPASAGEVYTGSGSTPATPAGFLGNDPSLNNEGRIAHTASVGGGERAVLARTPGGAPVRIAGTTVGSTYLLSPTINDNGNVAFLAIDNPSLDTLDGIYVGDGSRLDRVISPGDTLFGGTVGELFFDQGNMNNAGQLFFAYVLTDGTFGIAVATPFPEPACAGTLAAAAFLLLARVRPSR